jgi:hypothetical protein
VQAK